MLKALGSERNQSIKFIPLVTDKISEYCIAVSVVNTRSNKKSLCRVAYIQTTCLPFGNKWITFAGYDFYLVGMVFFYLWNYRTITLLVKYSSILFFLVVAYVCIIGDYGVESTLYLLYYG